MFDDTDYEALTNDQEYMRSEVQALEEQVITNPSAYSQSYDDFEAQRDSEEAAKQRKIEEEAARKAHEAKKVELVKETIKAYTEEPKKEAKKPEAEAKKVEQPMKN